MHSDESYSPLDELRAQVRDLAFELPSGDPGTARLHLLLMGLVQELGRLSSEMSSLAEEVLGERRYGLSDIESHRPPKQSGGAGHSTQGGITDDQHSLEPGPDGSVPGPARAPAFADHDARI
jgi:hypothetical protein